MLLAATDGKIYRKIGTSVFARQVSTEKPETWEEVDEALVPPAPDPAEQEISAEEAMSIITGGATDEA